MNAASNYRKANQLYREDRGPKPTLKARLLAAVKRVLFSRAGLAVIGFYLRVRDRLAD